MAQKRLDIVFLKIRVLCIFFYFLSSCSCNKGKLIYNIKLCNNISELTYRSFSQGAFGADVYTCYLTDSSNFIISIGSYDTYDEVITSTCLHEDTIEVFYRKRTESSQFLAIDSLVKLDNW